MEQHSSLRALQCCLAACCKRNEFRGWQGVFSCISGTSKINAKTSFGFSWLPSVAPVVLGHQFGGSPFRMYGWGQCWAPGALVSDENSQGLQYRPQYSRALKIRTPTQRTPNLQKQARFSFRSCLRSLLEPPKLTPQKKGRGSDSSPLGTLGST